MKKIFCAFLLFISVFGFTQEKVITTDEEYNYLSSGYKIAIETGQDLKKGYSLKEIGSTREAEFIFTFYQFKNDQNVTKAILVIRNDTSKKKNNLLYGCLPLNNEKLYIKFKGDFNRKVESWINFYDAALKLMILNK